MKILVTGASGFIGSYIVEEALRQGMETWAAVRPTSSRKYLQDERIHFINLNLSSEEELEKELAPHEFDYIVHAAGATKCLHAEDFYKVNTEGTKHLVNVLLRLQMPIRRFVFVSSLSILEPSAKSSLIRKSQNMILLSQIQHTERVSWRQNAIWTASAITSLISSSALQEFTVLGRKIIFSWRRASSNMLTLL